MTRGPASKFAFDPAVVAAFFDGHSVYKLQGDPPRKRNTINNKAIHPHDARIIRRWRAGGISGATKGAVLSLLFHYELSLEGLNQWAARRSIQPVLRGTTQESHE